MIQLSDASPIGDAPTDDPERTLLLFCPEQGGWQTGDGNRAIRVDQMHVLQPI